MIFLCFLLISPGWVGYSLLWLLKFDSPIYILNSVECGDIVICCCQFFKEFILNVFSGPLVLDDLTCSKNKFFYTLCSNLRVNFGAALLKKQGTSAVCLKDSSLVSLKKRTCKAELYAFRDVGGEPKASQLSEMMFPICWARLTLSVYCFSRGILTCLFRNNRPFYQWLPKMWRLLWFTNSEVMEPAR